MTHLSERGAQFIGHYEGWRDKPYNDPTNNATIGFGHLIHLGPVTAHDKAEWGTLTIDHGIQLLQSDASIAEAAIDQHITRRLAQCERDALTSFVFNCGGGALASSVGQAVNANQDPTPFLEQWDHSGHVVLEGLAERRKAEARLFKAGDYGDGAPPVPPHEPAPVSTTLSEHVPTPVPDWAWLWVEWKRGRAQFKGHAGDPSLRNKTGAPETIPPWGWVFLKRFQ